MYKYTVCFIRRGSEILLLNRVKAPTMGLWNGVGGKLEPNETPEESVQREIYEETGLDLENVEAKGVVTWLIDNERTGGMYTFTSEVPDDFEYITPRKVDEGILDWKELSWILDKENFGTAQHVPYFLPKILNETACYNHQCTFIDGVLTKYKAVPIRQKELSYVTP
jgi:8-oxo-dGTP diphosphatase